MTAGPPAALERALLWVIPPQVREEVAGDLWERYRSVPGYLADLIRTLPWIVASQGRLATEPSLFLLISFTLVASLGGLEPGRAEVGVSVPLKALATALPSLVTLLLRNAYRQKETWGGARAVGDVVWLGIALLLSRTAVALTAPSYALPIGWLIGGFVFTAIVMVLLRSGLEVSNTGLRPGLAEVADPRDDFARFRCNAKLHSGIEVGALGTIAGVAAWFGLTADRPIVSLIAGVWAAMTLLLVVHRWLRGGTHAVPETLTVRQALTEYVGELKRQRAASSLAWWWYFMPLFVGIGFSTIAFGLIAQRPLATITGVAASVAFAAMIVRVSARRRERLTEKITQLERTTRGLPA
jgi:hypothetical protein